MTRQEAIEILRERVAFGEREYMQEIPEYVEALRAAVSALEDMDRHCCEACKWHDDFSGACCNGDSEHRADFTDDDAACAMWEGAAGPAGARRGVRKERSLK